MGIIPEQLVTTTNDGYGMGEEDGRDGRSVVVPQCKSVLRKVCCSSSYRNKEDIQNGVSSCDSGGDDGGSGGADIQS
jgi:hypothetical protein